MSISGIMQSSDVDSTDVADPVSGVPNDASDDASPTFSGPLRQFMLSSVDRLRQARDGTDLTTSVNSDLVTAYSQLDKVDRGTVDRQLVDMLYVLTTRGFDVNAVCDEDDRQTLLHVVTAIPDTSR